MAGAALCTWVVQASADNYTFSNAGGDSLYNNGANWLDNTTGTSGTVPDLTTTNLAQINNGSAVNYVPGGDLTIKNGGTFEVTNGSFTQTVGNAYIQLNGGGTILVDGGTFNQGTASSSPFNVTGVGNVFNMSAGATNFNQGFNVTPGLASTLSGGTLTITGGNTQVLQSLTISGATATLGNSLNIASGGTFSMTAGSASVNGALVNNGTFSMSGGTLTTTNELDFNNDQNTLSGGTLHTTLITGVNGSGPNRVFNISGGALTLSNSFGNGIYNGGRTQYITFTASSTGQIEFLASTGATTSTLQGFISSNAVEYNNTPYDSTTGYSNFTITTDSMNDVFLGLAGVTPVPEPATLFAGALLSVVALPAAGRRWRQSRRSPSII